MLLKKELSEYNRYQAFATHMAISLVIFFILLACITQLWYPGILFDTGNGWKAIMMIVGIDLILGPLLTLIVFNPKKSSLKFDLSIIALIQIAALIYGTWTIHHTRPVAIAFVYNNFITIFANSEIGEQINTKTKELQSRELFYVFEDDSQRKELNPQNFEAYDNYANQIPSLNSPYKQGNLINIDPIISMERLIKIDPSTGHIIGFEKK